MCKPVIKKIDILMRAGIPIIVINSDEEARVESELRLLAQSRKKRLVTWSATAGFVQVEPDAQKLQAIPDPIMAVKLVIDSIPEKDGETAQPTIWVLRDIHHFFKQTPIIVRAFRDLATRFCEKKAKGSSVVILGGNITVPESLEKDVVLIEFPLPAADELTEQLDAFVANVPSGVEIDLSDNDRTALVRALAGLTKKDTDAALSQAAVTYRAIDRRAIAFVVEVKKEIIAKNPSTEYKEAKGLEDLGGWDQFKAYARRVRLSRTPQAKALGITPHKGIFLAGIPGCGKSLAATMLADEGMPVVTFNFAATKSKWVGESGQNLRSAFKLFEAIAPCVVIWDEVDKVMSASGEGANLQGGNVEQLGEALTWMQEHRDNGVFIVATANYVSGIDPAFVNRFNKSFFVDFPVAEERAEIFSIHIGKKSYDPKSFDLAALAEASVGFTGREIEMLVNEGIITSLDGGHEFCTADILTELADAIPLSSSMGKQLGDMRVWAEQASPVSSKQKSGNKGTAATTNAASMIEL